MFKEKTKVITSKGRFAKVISSDPLKSIVSIGTKQVEIYNEELLEIANSKAVVIEYYPDRFSQEKASEVLHISKVPIFDFSKPCYNFSDSDFFKECSTKLNKRINSTEFIIYKIKMV